MRKLLLFALLTLIACPAGAEPHRRALLIGINDYTSARPVRPLLTDRDWPNLTGAANDVRMMEELLVLLYGFERKDIATLTNQQASRVAIVQALETLAAAASKGDTVFFYFAGHGSQVRNTRSAEPDRLDESIVPADSRAGALDIRDKELRRVFNRILDRGARLTVFLDSCHSGSGARGLPTGARPRGIAPDLRDVADSGDPGPSPEERGALVLSASPDYELAWEVTGDDGNRHGAFSWAFARSIRAAAAGEPAMETFLRAQALLHGDRRYQDAVIGGGSEATRNPFLGTRTDRRGERAIVAVERIRGDGTIELAGGWANGLSIGTELRIDDLRLTVTRINGLGRAHARVKSNVRQLPRALAVGALAEVSGWAAPPGRPLRVWMPRAPENLAQTARHFAAIAAKRGVKWVADPTETHATHVLRFRGSQWEMLGAVSDIAKLPRGASLFVQFPAPPLAIEGITPTDDPDDADYILAGRYVDGRLTYAFIRPGVKSGDRRKSGMPVRTAWHAYNAPALREAAIRLRRIHAWNQLESPADGRSPYGLALRRERDRELVRDEVRGEERYSLLLRARAALPTKVAPRFVYAFTIDSSGKAILLFPRLGSVENRLPIDGAPPEILLGGEGGFEIGPPYGIDTFFLLTTDEPLPNPWILEWDGVRGPRPEVHTALEELLLLTGSGESRSTTVVTPSTWSIERKVVESISP